MAESNNEIMELIEKLRTDDYKVRTAVTRQIAEKARMGAGPLESALSDPDARVKMGIIRALGDARVSSSVEKLTDLLKDEDSRVRTNAAESLGKIGESRAVERLIGSLSDENKYVRAAAALALGKLRDASAIKPIINAFKLADPGERIEAVEALKSITGKNMGPELNDWLCLLN